MGLILKELFVTFLHYEREPPVNVCSRSLGLESNSGPLEYADVLTTQLQLSVWPLYYLLLLR
jgi:hypothetical protein